MFPFVFLLPNCPSTATLPHFTHSQNSISLQLLNFLKLIHPERLPTETQLLPNYPNPFNPETWIPFELHQDTNVSLVIYDVTGHQIRKIDLGHTLTGRYVTRDRSIYWDGRGSTPYALIRFTSRGFSMVGLFLIIVFWIALKRSISSLGNLD